MNEDLKFWLLFPVPLLLAMMVMLVGYGVGAAIGYAIARDRFKMDKKAPSKYEGPKGEG